MEQKEITGIHHNDFHCRYHSMSEFPLSDVLRLPVEERIRIVEAIWDSVAEQPDEISLLEWQVQELDTRFAAYQKDPSAGLTWTEVKHSILGQS